MKQKFVVIYPAGWMCLSVLILMILWAIILSGREAKAIQAKKDLRLKEVSGFLEELARARQGDLVLTTNGTVFTFFGHKPKNNMVQLCCDKKDLAIQMSLTNLALQTVLIGLHDSKPEVCKELEDMLYSQTVSNHPELLRR